MKPYGYIYKITNKVNGKVYIGKTTRGFDERYNYNFGLYTQNKLLKKDFDILGEDAFEVIKQFDVAYSDDELDNLEVKYIKEFHSLETECGYNRNSGGTHGKPTEPLRRELSEVHKGYIMPDEQKDKIRKANSGANSYMYGVPKSDEVKKKISESLKKRYEQYGSPNIGRRLSNETKEKLSKALKGRKILEESAKKTGNALRGKPKTEDHKRHISESRKGMVFSDEHKKHLSEAKKGKHLTDAHKSKIAEALKGRKTSELQKIKAKEASSKRVLCIETGIVYASGSDAAKSCGLTSGAIYRACKKETNTAANKHWKYAD